MSSLEQLALMHSSSNMSAFTEISKIIRKWSSYSVCDMTQGQVQVEPDHGECCKCVPGKSADVFKYKRGMSDPLAEKLVKLS